MSGHGLLQLVISTGVGGTAVALIAYRLRAKVDVWRMAKQADISAAQTPFAVLRETINKLNDQNAELRDQLYKVVSEHENRSREQQDALVRVLTKIEANMESMARDQRDLREEAARRSSQMHEDLGKVTSRLDRIEVKVGLRDIGS